MNRIFSFWKRLVLGLLSAMLVSNVMAQSKPLVVIVPWAQGSTLDSIVRSLAPSLEQQLKKKVMVLNLAGDGSREGHAALEGAPADGSMIGLISLDSAILQGDNPSLLLQKYQPLAQLTSLTPAIILPAGSPFRSTRDLILYAKTNPGKLRASGSAEGGSWHLALVGFLKANGLDATAITWVASAGAAPALQDLTADALDLVVMPASLATPVIAQGRTTVLSLFRNSRIASMPKVPTVAQDGSAPFEFVYWVGLAAPSSVTPADAGKLRAALLAAAADTSFGKGLSAQQLFEVDAADAAAFAARVGASAQQLQSILAGLKQ